MTFIASKSWQRRIHETVGGNQKNKKLTADKISDLGTYLKAQINLPHSEFKKIRHLFKYETYEKGKFIIHENSYSDCMIFLFEGYIRCYSTSTGKEITHWVYWKDRLVTDIPSFKRQRPSIWNFQTLSSCSLINLSYENYHQIKLHIPDWDIYENRILVKFFIALENRIHTFISMNATERYQILHSEHPEIFNRIPLIYISSLLNMAPETISRIRRNLIS